MDFEQFSIFDYLPKEEVKRPPYMDGAKVLSLFDGMACGMLAMIEAGVKVDRYVAYEYDETSANAEKGRPYGYAALTSKHNFPMIEHRGDVFKADFTEFSGFDWLVGGSPCTYWSIAQKNNRETEASGMGWELFSQYVRALREAKPMFFIYENNKSMSNAIRQSITDTFGFEPICINSALVSAQNRQRLYWVGKRNENGTYSKIDIEQPEDRGILLRDVLEGATDREKGRSVICYAGRTTHREYFQKHQGNMALEPVCGCPRGREKSRTLTSGYQYCSQRDLRMDIETEGYMGKQGVAEPVGIGYRGRMDNGKWVKQYESNGTGKANAITTAQTDSMVAQPVRVGALPRPNGELSTSQALRVYSADGKSVNLTAQGGGLGAKTGLYAVECNAPYATPCEWDEEGNPIKAVSAADGKVYDVYAVKDGQITIKGKTYPIKLPDGYYIIRKLTVLECMRLQTVPEWYVFPVSDSQAYKMLGNGWTVSVIAHLIKGAV